MSRKPKVSWILHSSVVSLQSLVLASGSNKVRSHRINERPLTRRNKRLGSRFSFTTTLICPCRRFVKLRIKPA